MNEDLFIQKIVKLEADVEEIKAVMGGVDSKMEGMTDMMNTLLEGQDHMVGILQRIDQERTFTNSRLERLENEVEKIKHHLHLDPA